MMSCACYSATTGRGEWHEFGTCFARFLHYFCISLRVQSSLALVLHAFYTSFAQVFACRHACALNSRRISLPERSDLSGMQSFCDNNELCVLFSDNRSW